jgi:hypothetical protein
MRQSFLITIPSLPPMLLQSRPRTLQFTLRMPSPMPIRPPRNSQKTLHIPRALLDLHARRPISLIPTLIATAHLSIHGTTTILPPPCEIVMLWPHQIISYFQRPEPTLFHHHTASDTTHSEEELQQRHQIDEL